MKQKLFFILSIFFLGKLLAQNTEVWTLNKCITYAKDNNISVQQLQLNSLSNKYSITQSWAELFPSVNASAGHTFNYGLSFDNNSGILQDNGYQNSFYAVQARWTIFNGLSNYYKIMATKHEYNASLYDWEQAINDVQLNIASTYLQVLFAQERLEIIKQQLDASKVQVDRNYLLYTEGAITKGDYLLSKSQQSTLELNKVNAENVLMQAKLSLIQSLNLQQDDIQIEKPDLSKIKITEMSESENITSIYEKSLTFLPMIKSKEESILAFRKRLSMARGAYYPSLSLNATFSTSFSELRKVNPFDPNSPTIDYGEQLRQNNARQFSFSLQIPIFNGLSVRTNVKQVKIQLKNAELNLQNEKFKLKNTIQKAFIDAKAAYNTYNANLMNLEALEEAYNYAKDKYEVRAINNVEYNDAANRYFNAKTELLIAQYDYILKTKVLDFYKGNKIEF